MAVSIAIENPLNDEMRDLIAALNALLLSLTPPEACHHLTVEQMADASTSVFVARDDGRMVACGALRRHAGGVGEVKRMYTIASYQGRGIGGAILAEIEALARREGLSRLVLETGSNFPAAIHLYRRAGFVPCGAVLDYPASPHNAFFEKPLCSGTPA